MEKSILYFRGDLHVLEDNDWIKIGITFESKEDQEYIVRNIDTIILKIHSEIMTYGFSLFDLGITISRCSQIANSKEILDRLETAAISNLHYNQSELSRIKLNNINSFLANSESIVIQPLVQYTPTKDSYSIIGGEVFIGGPLYNSYNSLIQDIPSDHDREGIDLLVLEKMIIACHGLPGILKFNVAPQFLIDVLNTAEKVKRLHSLIVSSQLEPSQIRLEITEHSYEEKEILLQNVCRKFWEYGISFAADDFGAKSSSHQVILELGIMIKEIKLVPMSFQIKKDEDHCKFLDNLSFIEYCIQLAFNRDAIITAEAVEDYTTIKSLMSHRIFHFQTNLFFQKISLFEYEDLYKNMNAIENEWVKKALSNSEILARQKKLMNLNKLRHI